jgi:hypothetical protein
MYGKKIDFGQHQAIRDLTKMKESGMSQKDFVSTHAILEKYRHGIKKQSDC